MVWTLTRTASLPNLPVSVSDLKDHLNVAQGDTSQDTKLESLIIAAKERVERDIDRVTINSSFTAYGPSFEDSIRLNIKPVTSVASVEYVDSDGVLQSLSSYRYLASAQLILPAIGEEFPVAYEGLPDAVRVSFTAGYGADSDCMPRLIQAAIKLCCGKWFYDPAQESSALHSQENSYKAIINNLTRSSYP